MIITVAIACVKMIFVGEDFGFEGHGLTDSNAGAGVFLSVLSCYAIVFGLRDGRRKDRWEK